MWFSSVHTLWVLIWLCARPLIDCVRTMTLILITNNCNLGLFISGTQTAPQPPVRHCNTCLFRLIALMVRPKFLQTLHKSIKQSFKLVSEIWSFYIDINEKGVMDRYQLAHVFFFALAKHDITVCGNWYDVVELITSYFSWKKYLMILSTFLV